MTGGWKHLLRILENVAISLSRSSDHWEDEEEDSSDSDCNKEGVESLGMVWLSRRVPVAVIVVVVAAVVDDDDVFRRGEVSETAAASSSVGVDAINGDAATSAWSLSLMSIPIASPLEARAFL